MIKITYHTRPGIGITGKMANSEAWWPEFWSSEPIIKGGCVEPLICNPSAATARWKL